MVSAVKGSSTASFAAGGLTSLKATVLPHYPSAPAGAPVAGAMSTQLKLLLGAVAGWVLYRADAQVGRRGGGGGWARQPGSQQEKAGMLGEWLNGWMGAPAIRKAAGGALACAGDAKHARSTRHFSSRTSGRGGAHVMHPIAQSESPGTPGSRSSRPYAHHKEHPSKNTHVARVAPRTTTIRLHLDVLARTLSSLVVGPHHSYPSAVPLPPPPLHPSA